MQREVLEGLSGTPKTLPCKYFYDQRGSQLFDSICELPEYYPTRTEEAIMQRHAHEMANAIGPSALVLELGSGSSTKTRHLLDQLLRPAVYVPMDISREHLHAAADRIAQEFDDLEVVPQYGDFNHDLVLPEHHTPVDRRVVYFPGSTIGNLVPDEAQALLARIAQFVGVGGGLLVGIDLQKDPAVLEAAYNDSQGVTAAFNKNLLRRLVRELGATIQLDQFEHGAIYNSMEHRIEMHLVSRGDQTLRVGGMQFEMRKGETIRTELSHKYHLEAFAAMATPAGWKQEQAWTDPQGYFAVVYFQAIGGDS